MQEHERAPFECSRLGDTATVVRTFVSHPREPEFPRILSGFDCEDSKGCGVGTCSANGLSWTFDWSLCVHPDARKGR